jgi:hypothetical protein
MNPNDRPVDHPPRSPDGLRKGGHTRAVGQTQWGCVDITKAKNTPDRSAPYQVIGSHADAPAKPVKPSCSEGNPAGFGPAGKGKR